MESTLVRTNKGRSRVARTVVVMLVAFALATPVQARRARVAFVNTDTNPAMSDFNKAFRAAAKDLDMEALEYMTDAWPASMAEELQKRLAGPDRPDYLVIIIHKGAGASLLQIAEQARVPVFVIISGLVPEDQARYGGPREKFKYWIGQMLPDDHQAGFTLANLLVDEAQKRGKVDPKGRVSLFAFGGNPADQCAVERNNGLQQAVASRKKEVVLLQLSAANWMIKMAAEKAPLVFERYPHMGAFWCANDAMALGVLPSWHKLPAASRPVMASIDWLPEVLQAVRQGEMVASLGGHTLDAAWAVVLIHDYHAGQDFASERVDFRSALYPLTRENLDDFQHFFADREWDRIDFTEFSKVHNPSLKRYDFSFGAVLAQQRDMGEKDGAVPQPSFGIPEKKRH